MISDEDKERVRQATDIVALVSETVVLNQRGNDFWGCCPFHQEKSPSFHVTPATGLWHCFGCHAGGDVFDYTMRREGLEFTDAIRYLADRAHVDIEETRGAARGPKRTRVIDVLEAAQAAYARRLMRGRGEGPDAARAYLASRGLNSKVCAKWHLGYADARVSVVRELEQAGYSRDEIIAADLATVRSGRLRDQFFNRVLFPIHDEQGRCIGFGGRVMGDAKPKYLNTRETSVFHKSKHLFAFDYAKDQIVAEATAIVTEGYMDVIAMHEAGFTNTVAALGTALSADHVKTLARFAKRIICMFDGDAAGQHAAEMSLRHIELTRAQLLCVVLPGGQDPDEFLRSAGADAMRAQLAGARPLLDFVLERKLAGLDLSSPGLRLAALDELARLLAPFKNSYLLDDYAQRVATPLGMTLDAVKRKVRSTPVEFPKEAPQPASGRQGVRAQGDGGAYGADGNYGSAGQGTMLRSEGLGDHSQQRDPSTRGSGLRPAGVGSPSAPQLSALSREDRTQLVAERNLLTMLAEQPDLFRPYADRIATFSWADARHEAIAWAILATPAGTTPADAVLAAQRACPDAARILSSGGFSATSAWGPEKNVEFVVDEAEVRSLDRRIAQLAATLAAPGATADAHSALAELSELRGRRATLRASMPRG